MASRIFVPRDAAARAVAPTRSLRRPPKRRNAGHRRRFRAYWLAWIVLAGATGRVETASVRIGFGPVAVKDVASLFADGLPVSHAFSSAS